MAKGLREIIYLFSSSGSGHFYTTIKNKRSNPEKIELNKFDPLMRCRYKYIEGKRNRLK